MTIARDEAEAISIYTRLIKNGYILKHRDGCWRVTEPNDRHMPQARGGLRSMREVSAWVDGLDDARFVTTMKKETVK